MNFGDWKVFINPEDSRHVYIWFITDIRFKGGKLAASFLYFYHDIQTDPETIYPNIYQDDEELEEINIPARAEKLIKTLSKKNNLKHVLVEGIFE